MKSFLVIIACLISTNLSAAQFNISGGVEEVEFNNLIFNGEVSYTHSAGIITQSNQTLFSTSLLLTEPKDAANLDYFVMLVDEEIVVDVTLDSPYWLTTPLSNMSVTKIDTDQTLLQITFSPGVIGRQFRGEFVSFAQNLYIDQLKFKFIPEPSTLISCLCIIPLLIGRLNARYSEFCL